VNAPRWLLVLIAAMPLAACYHADVAAAQAQPATPAASSAGATAPDSAPASGDAAPGSAATAAQQTPLPLPDLGYNAREGRALYRHYCLTCHGEEGHGDGFNAYNLDPRPQDLGDADFQKQHSDDDLVTVIRSGGGVAGLSNAMPPWGHTLNERQIRNLVVFLRTLQPEEP